MNERKENALFDLIKNLTEEIHNQTVVQALIHKDKLPKSLLYRIDTRLIDGFGFDN
jgi:hypothetical protein